MDRETVMLLRSGYKVAKTSTKCKMFFSPGRGDWCGNVDTTLYGDAVDAADCFPRIPNPTALIVGGLYPLC